jgi:hypothetical protein
MRSKKAAKWKKSWLIPLSFVAGLATVPAVSAISEQVKGSQKTQEVQRKKPQTTSKKVVKAQSKKVKRTHAVAKKKSQSSAKKMAKHQKQRHRQAQAH